MSIARVAFWLAASVAALVLAAASPAAADPPAANAPAGAESPEKGRPPRPQPVPVDDLEAAIQRGVEFLLKTQNKDGSWGSPALLEGVELIAEIGSHHAFQVAVTAMSVSALIESGASSPAARQALERGEKYLIDELPKVKRSSPMLIYNVWTHAYGIQALARMHERLPADAARRQQLGELIQGQYEKLVKYEAAEGGWGYYDFEGVTNRPVSASTSFVNAAVLVAMREAHDIGFPPPEKILKRALQATKDQRLPDGSYLYAVTLRKRPTHPVNLPGGSLGRSQSCALSLRVWGDTAVTDDLLASWLDRLVTRNGWLSLGRKKPWPHESFFAVSGYFFYFGHYYAGLCIDQLPAEERGFYKHHIARLILELQEPDGCWFDYPFYGYHKPYGTAFAIMTLNACRETPRALIRPREKP
jgi:hypothetical protein